MFARCLLIVCCYVLASCSINASLEYPRSTDQGVLLEFGVQHLSFVKMAANSYTTSQSAEGFVQVDISLRDSVYSNRLGFVNLPAEAKLHCDGADPNVAISLLDLDAGKKIQFAGNFWLADSLPWAAQRHQSFRCHYSLNGQLSNSIKFNILLNKSPVIRASGVVYLNGEGDEPVVGSVRLARISGDGRSILFVTKQTLVADDLNDKDDLYVYDRIGKNFSRVAVNTGGITLTGPPAISGNGRYVAFGSTYRDIVSGDTEESADVFVHDRQTGVNKMVSVSTAGVQADLPSGDPSISADGRYVAFASSAGNLVANDTNDNVDIFVRDLESNITTRVSVSSAGIQANGDSFSPSISGDGRYVAFSSVASNLVAGDTNAQVDIFVHDRQAGTTTLVSVNDAGVQGNESSESQPTVSGDGRFIAFVSKASNLVVGDTNGKVDIFVRDQISGTTRRASVDGNGQQINNPVGAPSLSEDGRFVAFVSGAFTGDAVFVYDLQTGKSDKTIAPYVMTEENHVVSISANGDTLAYASEIGVNQFQLVQQERSSGVATFITNTVEKGGADAEGESWEPSISADGRYVAFVSDAPNLVADDNNNDSDIFVFDRQTGTTTRVSVASDGTEANGMSEFPSISADGRYVAFASYANNLVAGDTNGIYDVFVHDRQTGTTIRASVASDGTQANAGSGANRISANGRFVTFFSNASNLVAGDSNGTYDIFVHDLQTHQTTRVSVSSTGDEANGQSDSPSISADGRYVAFVSIAGNLVAGDANTVEDIFVHDRQTGATTRVSLGLAGADANTMSASPKISADGRHVVFVSYADNIVAGDDNLMSDIFVHDRDSGSTTRVTVSHDGGSADGESDQPSISADGRYVAFSSGANNLVSDDDNPRYDVFVYDRQTSQTIRVSKPGDMALSYEPVISDDGHYVVFSSGSIDLVAGDANDTSDIFVGYNSHIPEN